MSPQVEVWDLCPLKQEIRAKLWESYVKKVTGGAALRSYLTLYSRSLMDVKYLTDRGLITFDGEKYRGVVGVTHSPQAYAQAVRRGRGRLEQLLVGDIRNILISAKSRHRNELSRMGFPFEAVNLDYTDSLFCASISGPISSHFQALETLFHIQNRSGCQRFCLFLTTRAETGQFAPEFLSELENRIDDNMINTPNFGQLFFSTYGVETGGELRDLHYQDFATLGLIKLVISMLSEFPYEAVDCNAMWLIRDARRWPVSLLHLAFMMEKQRFSPATSIRLYGKRRLQCNLQHVVTYMNNRATSRLSILKQSTHKDTLQRKHGNDIARLMAQTYELKLPEQVSEQEG